MTTLNRNLGSSVLVCGALVACSSGEGSPGGTTGSTTSQATTTSSGTAGGEGGAGGAGGTTGAGGAAGVLLSGPGYGLVYTSTENIGIDSRPDCEATFDGQGHFVGYASSDNEHLAIGAASNAADGSDALSAWGVWNGGPTTGKFYALKPDGDFTFDPLTGGFHYAVGKTTPTRALPTSGTLAYALVGGSAPTRENATGPGALTDFSVSMDFGAAAATVAFSVTMPDGDAAATLEATLANAGTFRVLSGFSADAVVRGIFAGPGAERLVLVYQVAQNGGTVRGSAVLRD